MNYVQLGDICEIQKGQIGISKAVPGKYPLVTTGEERRSHNAYQLDTKAVLIPLVSATGHGHASIKRVHYQEGKFAFGSILAACVPKDESYSAEFLYIYLQLMKDTVLVPLMKGSANVSLTIKNLKTAKIPAVSVDFQQRLIKKYKSLRELTDKLTALTKSQKSDLKSLKSSILEAAVLGKLTTHWREGNPNVEPASELLKRIDVEIKKRRSVPSNTEVPDSILNMVIVDSWSTKTIANLLEIGAILDLKDGNHGNNHPVKADFTEKGLPFITAAQVLTDNRIDYDGAYKLAGKPLAKIKIGHAIKDDVIFTHKGSIGRVAIADRDCILSPQTTYYRLNQMVFDKTYIMYCLLSPLYKIQYDLVKKQSTRDYVSLKKQYLFTIPIPPIKEQQAIVEKVNSLMSLCDQLEKAITLKEEQATLLMKSCVAEALA